MTAMTDREAADVLRWLDAQADDPNANERFRELRDYIAHLHKPGVAGMAAMTDSKAADMLAELERDGDADFTAKERHALAHAVARLRAAEARGCGEVKCPECYGSGDYCLAGHSAHPNNWRKCETCKGTGTAPPSTPEAVDGAMVERACRAVAAAGPGEDRHYLVNRETMRAALTAALAKPQGGA